jgi:hypothetical protein
LSFDKSNEDKVTEFLKKIDEKKEILKTSKIHRSDIIIFFIAKRFIESDNFKIDWKN